MEATGQGRGRMGESGERAGQRAERRLGGLVLDCEGLGRGRGQSSLLQLDLEPASGTARLQLSQPPPALSINGRLFFHRVADQTHQNPHAPLPAPLDTPDRPLTNF